MNVGEQFVNKCLETEVIKQPWPYQVIPNTLPKDVFEKFKKQCKENLNYKTTELAHIFPHEFKKWNIDFYDETYNICVQLLKNAKQLCDVYPNYRKYPKLGVNAHISVTPPLPYKFKTHSEGLEKVWSSVTYVTPDNNVGTKMYTAESEQAFVQEAPWVPNTTFIFCGQRGKTWHSYESNQTTNRISLNLFIMSDRKKCFLRDDG